MSTIYDVAKRARVSTYTVSVVLNGTAKASPKLTKRVLKAADELNYTINSIASSLQTRKTMTIGMLIPDIGNPWFAKVVRGVEDICREKNYSLFLGNTSNDAETQNRYLTVLRSRQVEGVLLFMAADSEAGVAELVKSKKFPVVFVGRRPRMKDADFVVADNRLGTKLAVDHLIARGHKRIAILTGQLPLLVSEDRVKGWRESLKKASLEAPREFIKAGDWTAGEARKEMHELMALKNRPTAVFASNLLIMNGVLAALRELKLSVPGDVEVMCSDDSEWLDVFDPQISVVLQPAYEMGTAAARLLFEKINEPKADAQQIVLKPELKLR